MPDSDVRVSSRMLPLSLSALSFGSGSASFSGKSLRVSGLAVPYKGKGAEILRIAPPLWGGVGVGVAAGTERAFM